MGDVTELERDGKREKELRKDLNKRKKRSGKLRKILSLQKWGLIGWGNGKVQDLPCSYKPVQL